MGDQSDRPRPARLQSYTTDRIEKRETTMTTPERLEQAAVEAALQARALINGIVAAIFLGIGMLVAWAAGSLNDQPDHHENSSAAFIAGILCLIGIVAGWRAWRCWRASRGIADVLIGRTLTPPPPRPRPQ